MVAVPADIPATIPVGPTVATDALLLFHIPPGVALLNAAEAPTHTVGVPVILPGVAITFTVAVATQPVENIL